MVANKCTKMEKNKTPNPCDREEAESPQQAEAAQEELISLVSLPPSPSTSSAEFRVQCPPAAEHRMHPQLPEEVLMMDL